MKRGGYDPYRGRSRFRTGLKVLIGLLAAALVLAVAAFLWLEPYIDYSAGGIRISLPFFRRGEPVETGGVQAVVTTPEAAPSPTPEPEEPFRALLLPAAALTDGTAAERLQAAGANAAVFDMKPDSGLLAYASGLEPAAEAGASAADPAVNGAIGALNGGELYTVARVSCFRDNTVPRADMSLALHTSAGNWRDAGEYRWLSPASREARQCVGGGCRALAGRGSDELLLDNWSFPASGELSWLVEDENYPAGDLTTPLEAFLAELRAALADWPEVRVSLVTDVPSAAGERPASGQTAALLEGADRVLVRLEEGETLPVLGEVPVTAAADAPGGPGESWAVLTLPAEEENG